MTHDVAPPGPLPHAAQAPYPAHPAPKPHHGEMVPVADGAEAIRPAPLVGQGASDPPRTPADDHPTGGLGAGRGWLIAAGAGAGLAIVAALLPLLRRRPEPPKRPKGKKGPRRRK